MAKVNIKTLAAGAEIIASIAVVASLLLVVASIDQNTRSLQSINDNFLYELQLEWLRDVSNGSELASIVEKFSVGEELTSTETRRYRYWQLQQLNMWEIAFVRYNEGLMTAKQWRNWNRYWSNDMPDRYPEAWWSAIRDQYSDDFAAHVDAVYKRQ